MRPCLAAFGARRLQVGKSVVTSIDRLDSHLSGHALKLKTFHAFLERSQTGEDVFLVAQRTPNSRCLQQEKARPATDARGLRITGTCNTLRNALTPSPDCCLILSRTGLCWSVHEVLAALG